MQFIILLAAAGLRDGDEARRQRRHDLRRVPRRAPTAPGRPRSPAPRSRRSSAGRPRPSTRAGPRWRTASSTAPRSRRTSRPGSSPALPTATCAPTRIRTGFDIGRTGALLGIAFGHGIHYRIGAHLARLEGKIALTELYRRWLDLEVDLAAVQYVHMANVAGPSSVPVTV